jgi:hypothetical protein
MKTKSRQSIKITTRVFTTAVILMGFLSLSGCITGKVLDLRQKRETRVKEATNFWSLAAVRSAQVVAGGDAFACVEFRDAPGDTPQAYTINLSQTPRLGRTYADFMPAGSSRNEGEQRSGSPAEPDWRLYPLQEAQKGCDKAVVESPFPTSELKAEALQIRREDQSRLPEMLLPPDGEANSGSRLIEVRFLESGSSETRDVLLVYLPPAKEAEQAQAIGVAGAFEPGSEWVNPYSLLVVPALAADTAIITTAVLVFICSHGGCR